MIMMSCEHITERREWKTESRGTPTFTGQGDEEDQQEIQKRNRQNREENRECGPRSQGNSGSRRKGSNMTNVARRVDSN